MTRRRAVLLLAILLAAAWTSWLAYEAYTAGDPIVVSRPQLLVAPVIVEGELVLVRPPGCGVRATHIYRGQELLPPNALDADGALILVAGLVDPPAPGQLVIVALRAAGRGTFEVVPTPSSPGHRGGRTPMYPATASTRAQVRQALGM